MWPSLLTLTLVALLTVAGKKYKNNTTKQFSQIDAALSGSAQLNQMAPQNIKIAEINAAVDSAQLNQMSSVPAPFQYNVISKKF